jgi:hypothetical protein
MFIKDVTKRTSNDLSVFAIKVTDILEILFIPVFGILPSDLYLLTKQNKSLRPRRNLGNLDLTDMLFLHFMENYRNIRRILSETYFHTKFFIHTWYGSEKLA